MFVASIAIIQEKVVVSARGGGPQGLPFNEVNPSYEADQDIWGRPLDRPPRRPRMSPDVFPVFSAVGKPETMVPCGFQAKGMAI